MNTVQGKNVVVLGGLQGVGLKLTINLLNRRVRNLYIVDIYDNQTKFLELKNRFQTTNLFYKRIDELRFNTEIQRTFQDVCLKIQYVDFVVNALEFIVERDLQRTMDLNMKIYLNTMMAARNVMDRTKGGRGGKIINVLSNLGLQNLNGQNYYNGKDGFDQQYLINKQMLLSLTEAYSQDEFFQQTGVAVMTLMPCINKNLLRRNMDWVRTVGLDRMVDSMNNLNQWTNDLNNRRRFDIFDDNTDFYRNNVDFEQNFLNYQNYDDVLVGYNNDGFYDLQNNQGWMDTMGNTDSVLTTNNMQMMLNMMCYNMLRGMEMGRNGDRVVIGFNGIKNMEKMGYLSRL